MNDLNRLKDLAVSESGFVFDPYSGATFNLNSTGLVLMQGLQEGVKRAELIARLEESFDVVGFDLDRDVGEFVRLLCEHAIVSATFSVDEDAVPENEE